MTKPELQASERAKRAAEALLKEYSIGTFSTFCDDPADFDEADIAAVAKTIERACHLRELEAVVEALRPFAHPDLATVLSGNVQGDDSPVFGRNKAVLTIGDFKRAIAALKSIDAAKDQPLKKSSQHAP